MKSWSLKNNSKIYQVLSGRSNFYLYQSANQTFLFDTGKTNRFQQLIKNINSIGFKKIDWLLLTHTHFDHCQNATELKKHFNLKIAIHENAVGFAQNGFNPLPNGSLFFTKQIAKMGQLMGANKFGFQNFISDIILQNKNTIDDIEIIHTPGHSYDSVCFLVGKEIGIVGDTMFGVFKRSIYPPYANNVDQLIISWSKLLRLNCHTFLPGHGNPIAFSLLNSQHKKYSKV